MHVVAKSWVLVTHGVRKNTDKSRVMIKVLWWNKRTIREDTYQDYVRIQSNDTRKSRGILVDTERRTLNEVSNASECWRMRLLREHTRILRGAHWAGYLASANQGTPRMRVCACTWPLLVGYPRYSFLISSTFDSLERAKANLCRSMNAGVTW